MKHSAKVSIFIAIWSISISQVFWATVQWWSSNQKHLCCLENRLACTRMVWVRVCARGICGPAQDNLNFQILFTLGGWHANLLFQITEMFFDYLKSRHFYPATFTARTSCRKPQTYNVTARFTFHFFLCLESCLRSINFECMRVKFVFAFEKLSWFWICKLERGTTWCRVVDEMKLNM